VTPARRSHIVAGVAGDEVGQRIAGAVDVATSGQGQILDIAADDEGDRAVDEIGAAGWAGLDDDVARLVHCVIIVAVAAAQGIGACAAVEPVIAAVAGDDIGQRVSEATDVRTALEREILDLGTR
jgi:hypothetical protein